MPTVLRKGAFRFFFYAADQGEPPHIHVERDDCLAKFWLKPVRLHDNGGFNRHDVRQLQKLVEEHREALLRSWDEFFGR